DHPWIRQSAKLCDEAIRDITNGTNLELWLRGLLPSTWNSVPPPPSWGMPCLPYYIDWDGPTVTFEGKVNFEDRIECKLAFLDGSASSCDARLARAGWGVYFAQSAACVENDDPDTPRPRACGGLDGAQTVPCAELAALWWALKMTKGPIWLYTGSQIVYDGWHGSSDTSGELKGWWKRVFTEDQGNDLADKFAQLGVEQVSAEMDPE
ncbi:unnamed protein product, partial [Prorocentrum cordatum]